MTFPVIPNFASASTFTDSGEAWDGAANKSTLSLSSFPQGFLPGAPVPAEDVNALINALCNEVIELRQSASLPVYIGGATTSDSFMNASISFASYPQHYAIAPIEDVRNMDYAREVLPGATLLTAYADRIAGEPGFGSLLSSAALLTDLHCLTPSAGACIYAATALYSTTYGRIFWLLKGGSAVHYHDLEFDTTQRYSRGNGMCSVADPSGNTHIYTMYRHNAASYTYRFLHIVIDSDGAFSLYSTPTKTATGTGMPSAVESVRLMAPWWGTAGSTYGFVALGYQGSGSVVHVIAYDQSAGVFSDATPFGTSTSLIPLSIRYDPWDGCYYAHFRDTSTNASIVWKSQGTNVLLAWTQVSSITYLGPQYLGMDATSGSMVPVDCVHIGSYARVTVWAGSATSGSTYRRYAVRKEVYDGSAWVDSPVMIAPNATGTSTVPLYVSLCKNGPRSVSIMRSAPNYGSAATSRYFDLWNVKI